MIENTQKIRRQKPTKCLSMFDHFVGLALKGLKINPLQWRLILYGGISFISALDESTQRCFSSFYTPAKPHYASRNIIPLHLNHKQLLKGFLYTRCSKNRMQRCMKSRQTSCRISLKYFIFSTVVGVHLASLLKKCNSSFTSILQRDCLDFEST